jgi:putative glycosyltransferase (TIGR04372 family)
MRIIHHISAIKKKGSKEFFRKTRVLKILIIEITWFIIFLPFSICVLFIIRALSPILIIRLDRLRSWRIGHYADNPDLYLCEKKNGINHGSIRTLDIWFDRTKPCNFQLRIMLKRVINIYPRWLVQPVHILNNYLPGGEKHNIPKTTCDNVDVLNLIHNSCSSSHFEFTTEEEDRGKIELKKIGIKYKSKFVCLIVRDSAYLEHQKIENSTGVDWSYHDYRDTEIHNYELAINELVKNGYYVIRMGVKVNTKLSTKHPMIIDYATNGMRSDFMDIYLGAKCEFCISTSTGYDSVPRLFRRPVVIVNQPHVERFYSWLSDAVTIFQKVRDVNTGKYLSLKSIIESGIGAFGTTNEFVENGVELIENTPEEIKDAVVEMMLRLNGKWHDNWYDSQARSSVESIYSKSELNGKILSRFGTAFLKDNLYLLEYNND